MGAAGTANQTIHIEDGEQVYPCRCGDTHRGPYALYDFAHHNCFHYAGLIRPDDAMPDYLLCPECGQSFEVVLPQSGRTP